jgi:galactose mutarotase-like enzyme
VPRIADLTPVSLAAGDLTATFIPGAGMVGSSLTHRGDELLGQRGGVAGYVERGSTFGIPLLHPWANRLGGDDYGGVSLAGVPRVRRDEHGLPIHGLLHAWPGWEVLDTTTDRLRTRTDLTDLPGFPFPHVLELHVHLSAATLTIATLLRATGDVAVPVSFGFHPYLAPPGAPRGAWRLDLPRRRRLALDDRGLPTGVTHDEPAETVLLDDTIFDDLYDELPTPPEFAVTTGGRRITVRFEHGYPVAQIYAPPGADLVCFEPMTAPTDALRTAAALPTAAPGTTFTGSFSITVGAA